MPTESAPRRIGRFGRFEADLHRRELRRDGRLIPLQDQPFSVLSMLLEHPDREVSREELRQRLWPDQDFLDFETGINTAVAKLRQALGDSAEDARFIATRPRKGYRFIAPVAWIESGQDAAPQEPFAHPHPPATGTLEPAPIRPIRFDAWAGLSLVLICLAAAWVIVQRSRPVSRRDAAVAFSIAPPAATFSTSGGLLAVSPDGRYVAFVVSDGFGQETLWLRALSSPDARQLPGTEGAHQPFWSADSQQLAFFAGDKLKRVDIAAGAAQTICSVPIGAFALAGTWNAAGDILFSSVRGDIVRVSASGGVPVTLIPRDSADHAVNWPQFLPDGRHFLYLVDSAVADRTGIYVGSLDSPRRLRISDVRSYAQYTPGHLLFVRDGALLAHPFDTEDLRLTGRAALVADRVAFNPGTARATFAASAAGVLAYRTVTDTELVWMDRSGRQLGSVGAPGPYHHFAVSPDGARVAASRLDSETGVSHVWVIDAASGHEHRLTFDTSWEMRPFWSRDGSAIMFNSARRGRQEIYAAPSNGEGPVKLVRASDVSVSPEDWTADGGVLFQQSGRDSNRAFGLTMPGGNRTRVIPYLEADESSGRLSPDGRWLAYRGYDSGWFIYVRSIDSATRWQLSGRVNNHSEPRWRGDGRELFYLGPDLAIMAADVEPGATFRAGPPRRLFRTNAFAPSGLTGQAYDVTADGQRFLIKTAAAPPTITVIVNWPSIMREAMAPSGK